MKRLCFGNRATTFSCTGTSFVFYLNFTLRFFITYVASSSTIPVNWAQRVIGMHACGSIKVGFFGGM